MNLVLALLAATLPLWPISSWVQFRHNIGNNNVVRGSLSTSWQVQTGGTYSSSPSEAGGVVYLGNNDGTLYAIDAASGHVLWTFRAHSSLMTNPLVLDGSVIVGEGNQISYVDQGGLTKVGTSENAIIALDTRTGQERWRVPLSGTGMPTPALIDNVLVEHDGIGDVTGIDAKTGHVLYRSHIGGAASMVSMLPVGRERFVSSSVSPNSVWEIDGRNGKVVWQHTFDDTASGLSDCPPASDGKRIFCDYSAPPQGVDRAHVGALAVQRVFGIDAKSGSLLWDVPLAVGTLPQWNEASIPLVYNRGLYVGSSVAAQVASINAKTGKILWRHQVNGAVKGGICGKDGVLYFGDYAGYLWALDARTGRTIGAKSMHTIFNVGSPLIAGETFIIGTNTGQIIALPLAQIRNSHDG
jgi:outer membrane protein assembly factor BamB